MIYMCTKCYKLHSGEYNRCCERGSLVYIDELIAPIIQSLNQKGYRTRYCCSSHNYTVHGYIFFDGIVPFGRMKEHYFTFDRDMQVVRWDNPKYDKENPIKTFEGIIKVMKALRYYTDKLPMKDVII